MSSVLMPTNVDQLPIIFTRGRGVWLWDNKGKTYLDALSGLGVCALGHCHPNVTKALAKQAAELVHISNTYHNEPQLQLAEKLVDLSKMERIVFVNSGAEAVETGIKLTRLFARQKGVYEPTIITIDKAFHGHTLGATGASTIRRAREGFEPLLMTFIHAPFDDLQTIEKIITTNPNVVAIQLEPIQGDGGIRSVSDGYLKQIRALCDHHNLLLFLDEVLCGLGRTGKWFAFQHEEIQPDILTVAKPLANGIPIGACLTKGKAAHLFKPGQHGSTFGGNPLACAVALSVIDTIEKENILQNVAERGEQIRQALRAKLMNSPHVRAIRGKGLMIGVELVKPYPKIMQIGLERGILFNTVDEKVIRILPPYTISEDEAHQVAERLIQSIESAYVLEKEPV